MKRLDEIRRVLLPTFGVLATAFFLMGADEPKQTIDAKGLTFEVPKSWKSSTPTKQSRRAELKVEPIEGDDYPAEMIVFAFRRGCWVSRRQPLHGGRTSSKTKTAIHPRSRARKSRQRTLK